MSSVTTATARSHVHQYNRTQNLNHRALSASSSQLKPSRPAPRIAASVPCFFRFPDPPAEGFERTRVGGEERGNGGRGRDGGRGRGVCPHPGVCWVLRCRVSRGGRDASSLHISHLFFPLGFPLNEDALTRFYSRRPPTRSFVPPSVMDRRARVLPASLPHLRHLPHPRLLALRRNGRRFVRPNVCKCFGPPVGVFPGRLFSWRCTAGNLGGDGTPVDESLSSGGVFFIRVFCSVLGFFFHY